MARAHLDKYLESVELLQVFILGRATLCWSEQLLKTCPALASSVVNKGDCFTGSGENHAVPLQRTSCLSTLFLLFPSKVLQQQVTFAFVWALGHQLLVGQAMSPEYQLVQRYTPTKYERYSFYLSLPSTKIQLTYHRFGVQAQLKDVGSISDHRRKLIITIK